MKIRMEICVFLGVRCHTFNSKLSRNNVKITLSIIQMSQLTEG
jgi:hypothetical protein